MTSIERVLAGAEHLAAGDLEAALGVPAQGRLGATVGAAVQLVADSIRERESLQQQLAHQASHDQLTGLPTRGAAEQLLQERVDAARSGTADSAVLFVDLDHFKQVNDTHGHAAGDHVLRIAAARMSAVVPAGGTVCRLGGDEFVVLLSGDVEAAARVGARIVAALAEPISWDSGWLRVGGSVGIGICDRDADSVDAVLNTADAAVYRVKARGRGGVEVGLVPAGRAADPAPDPRYGD